MSMLNEQLKKHIHRELTGASVKIFEQVGNNYEFRGTGFFITPDGYLLTAYHCVKDAPDDIFVKTHFDGQFKAVLDQRKSLRDSEYDIAVLKIDYQPNHYLPLGIVTDEHITDEIVAVGYPAGHKPENTQIKIFMGRISGFRTDNKIENDAVKGQGQSGGLVYHYKTHRVIGLATAGYKPEVILNTGLATRFQPLFRKWRELEQINRAVAKNWIELLNKLGETTGSW
jgi:S1-C subfamily serine protease